MNYTLLISISFYMVLMLLIGYWSSRRIGGVADFLVAGRNLPFSLALATTLATWFGAGTCMGAAGVAYSDGILGVIADPFAAGIALIIAGIFYVGLLRRMKLMTITDVFGIYYDKNSEIFASLLMIPVYIGWVGSQMVAMGYLINIFTGLDTNTGIVIATIIVLVYTYAGGMWAVTITDAVQISILIIGLIYTLPIALHKVGGWESLVSQTPKEFWHLYPHTTNYGNWLSYAGQWGLMGLGVIVGQDLIQRSLSCKTEKIAQTSAIWSGLLYLTLGFIPVILGFVGRIVLPGLEDPEMVLPKLAIELLSPFGEVIFIGAIISAIMSSADSSLLAGSSLLTNNVLRHLYPKENEQTFLKWNRAAILIFGVMSMILALYVQKIYVLMVNSWATLLVAILVPVTAALYWRKANRTATWVSMIAGVYTWIGYIVVSAHFVESISEEIFYQGAAYGGVASLSGYVIITLIRYKNIPDCIPVKLQKYAD